MFNGSIVALVTPFREGAVDETALRNLLDWHVEAGTHGILVVGTTGESVTLSQEERYRVMAIASEHLAGRCPLMAGTGSNNPQAALTDTQYAETLSIDATLHVAGYYNRPNQEGLYQHFKCIHDASTKPIFIYNIPPRAIVDVQPETMQRLSELPRVVGVKDATGEQLRIWEEKQRITSDFCWLSGDDPHAVFYNLAGGSGCISVTANVAPVQVAALQNHCLAGNWQAAQACQEKLMPLHKALFMEPSPSGAKYALSLLGRCTPESRLPILPVSEKTQKAIQTALRELSLLD